MKTANKYWKIFIGLQVIILILATSVDLNLSHLVFNKNSIFGYTLELLGELPLSIMAASAALYKALSYLDRKKISAIIHFILTALFALMSGFQLPHYLNLTSVPLSITIFIIMLILVSFIVNRLPKNDEKLLKYASLIIFVAFMNVLVINVIKQFWGRERYRHMVEMNNYDNFSAWFIPQGMASGEEFKSFPSGHSANASIVMLLALYPFKNKEIFPKVFIGVSIYTVAVQLSRIIQGAHFLSDVTMGVIVGLAMIFIGAKIFGVDIE